MNSRTDWIEDTGRVQGQISLEDMEFANRYLNRRAETKHDFTGEPGDIIATDTLSGVGVGFKPPRFLKPEDIVTLTIP